VFGEGEGGDEEQRASDALKRSHAEAARNIRASASPLKPSVLTANLYGSINHTLYIHPQLYIFAR
jgi:hypothetical protein